MDSQAKLRILLDDPEGAELDIRQAMVLAPYDPLLRRERVDEWLELGRTDLALLELDTLLGEAPGDAGLEAQARLRAPGGRRAITPPGGRRRHSGHGPERLGARPAGMALVRLGRPARRDLLLGLSPSSRSPTTTGGGQPGDWGMPRALPTCNGPLGFPATGLLPLSTRPVRRDTGDLGGGGGRLRCRPETGPGRGRRAPRPGRGLKLLGDHAAPCAMPRVVERTRTTSQAWNMKGDLHLLFGEYVEAVDHYDRAISLDPETSEHLHDKGLAW